MNNNNHPIIFAWAFDYQGGGNKLEHKDVANALESEKLAWVHLDANHENTRQWLRREIHYLDELILDALLAEETRPRVLEYSNGLLLILRGMNFNQGNEIDDMIAVRLWIDDERIISVQRRVIHSITDVADKLSHSKGPKNSGDFLMQLATRLFERMEPVMNALDEKVDDIEEKVITRPVKEDRYQIIEARRQAINFRRYISPQRDVMQYIRQSDIQWISELHKRQSLENYNRLQRYTEDLDSIRERAQIVKDELINTITDKLNKNMYILSIISAIFLPLGFLTGLFGINVGGIPGVESPHAFYIFCIATLILVSLQVWTLYKLKWFN